MRGSENFPAPLSHEHQVGVEHVNSVTASACQQQPWSRPALSGGRASRGMRLAAPAGSPPQRLVCCRASAQVRLCELVNRLKGVFPAAEAGISAISTFRSRRKSKGSPSYLVGSVAVRQCPLCGEVGRPCLRRRSSAKALLCRRKNRSPASVKPTVRVVPVKSTAPTRVARARIA
jgi:hypothetical protein